MQTNNTFSAHTLGSITLKNKIVMAPMTRSRAIGNKPNELIAKYYAQRSSAGLIITEGTSPSPNGLGYARIPGIYNKEQVEAWKSVTKAVHENDGKIFLQLMHTGRIAHPHNLPKGARVVAPSPIVASGEMWTDLEGKQSHPIPQELTAEDIETTKQEFVQAALNAIDAGFDGVELHAANGYLLEQFLSPRTNKRTDEYGGNVKNRTRFLLETVREISDYIGRDKVGVRVSPYGTFNDMTHYPEIDETYMHLAQELNKIGIVYLHLFDQGLFESPQVPVALKQTIRETFTNTILYTGGYDLARAHGELTEGLADLVGFGRPFINNPDLVDRFRKNYPINPILDFSTFYTPGEKGYTDYRVYEEEAVSA
jgi:N-ethylmaleimide reductase